MTLPREEFQAGRVLSAKKLNEFFAELERLGKVAAQAPLTVADDASGLNFAVGLPERWYLKLTSGGTGGKYAWTRQIAATGGTWAAHPGGRTGTTTTDPAYESNLNASVNLSPNPVVLAWRDPVSLALIFQAGTC